MVKAMRTKNRAVCGAEMTHVGKLPDFSRWDSSARRGATVAATVPIIDAE
jgi:hypothetical protein